MGFHLHALRCAAPAVFCSKCADDDLAWQAVVHTTASAKAIENKNATAADAQFSTIAITSYKSRFHKAILDHILKPKVSFAVDGIGMQVDDS